MSIIEIYYTNIGNQLSENAFQSFLSKLPFDLKEKNSKFVRWQDKYANLFGKILLLNFLNKNNDLCLEDLKYNKYSRPYFDGDFDFNISHSGTYVLCAFAKDVRLGIDIEKVAEIDFMNFQKVMTADQWNEINSSFDAKQTFFNYWAMKESVIKAEGKGMSIPLLEIDIRKNIVSYNDRKWYLKKIDIEQNYSCFLATDSPNIIILKKQIDFNELSNKIVDL